MAGLHRRPPRIVMHQALGGDGNAKRVLGQAWRQKNELHVRSFLARIGTYGCPPPTAKQKKPILAPGTTKPY
jgi:hypothetical protein